MKLFRSHSPAPPKPQTAAIQTPQVRRPDPETVRRALAEAEERRRRQADAERPAELGGPEGPEPTRYGDWERKGICTDF